MTRNVRGYRVGESHGRATQSDALVRELRFLYEAQGVSCRELIALFAERGVVIRYRWLRKIVAHQIRPHQC